MNEGMRRYLDSLPEGSVRDADPKVIAEYERSMREDTIPAIEKAIRDQARAAHYYRLGIPDPAIAAAARQGGDVEQAPSPMGSAVGNAETPEQPNLSPSQPSKG